MSDARGRLVNYGNTCYINSTLQALCSSKHFVSFIKNKQSEWSKDKQPVAYAFALVCEKLLNTSDVVKPGIFIEALCKTLGKSMEILQQNDAMEFATLLFDQMNTEIGRKIIPVDIEDCASSYEKLVNFMSLGWQKSHQLAMSRFSDLVYGQHIVQLHCFNCGKNEHHSEIFVCIDVSLPEMVNSQMSVQDLVCNSYICENVTRVCDFCNEKESRTEQSNGKRSLRVWKSPKTLLVHLKRFNTDGKKVTTSVMLSNEINLEPIAIYTTQTTYELAAIICHSGSSNSGHYFTITPSIENEWLLYDDDMNVRKFNTEQVHGLSSMFYVLVYDKV